MLKNFLNLILLILKLYDLKEVWRPFWLYLIKTKQKVNQILSYWNFLTVLGSRGHMFSFNNSNPLTELSVPNNYKSAKYQISPNSLNLKPCTWNRHLYSIRIKLLCFISGWCLTNSTAIPTNTKSGHDSFFFTCQLCQHVYPYSSNRNNRNISIPSCP